MIRKSWAELNTDLCVSNKNACAHCQVVDWQEQPIGCKTDVAVRACITKAEICYLATGPVYAVVAKTMGRQTLIGITVALALSHFDATFSAGADSQETRGRRISVIVGHEEESHK